MPSKCANTSRGLTMWRASRGTLIPPRRRESTACPVSSSADASPCRARRRPNISRKRSRAPRTNEPSSRPPVSTFGRKRPCPDLHSCSAARRNPKWRVAAPRKSELLRPTPIGALIHPTRDVRSCSLGRLPQRYQVAENGRGSAQARLGILPIVEEDHLHVGPHPRGRTKISDKGHEPLGVGEGIVAERHQRPLGPGLYLFHIGLPAQRFDRDHLEEMLDLLRQWPEPVDKLGAEGLDLALVLNFRKTSKEREPHRQI